jgi:electron transfer flavoprotein alpha subunit
VAIGASGKFNHMAGVRSAGTVLGINPDPSAPLWAFCDAGIVAPWQEVLPLLVEELRRVLALS